MTGSIVKLDVKCEKKEVKGDFEVLGLIIK